jgi:hypothetical protein
MAQLFTLGLLDRLRAEIDQGGESVNPPWVG